MTASLHGGKHAAMDTGLRRVAANLKAWLSLVARPRRFKESRLLPPRRRLARWGIAGVALVAFCLIVLDARGGTFAATAAVGRRDLQRDHRLRRSGWTRPDQLLIVLGDPVRRPPDA